MTDNELLLAMSEMMDKKLEPMKKEIRTIRVDLLENNIIPRLNTIESCYLSTYNRYVAEANEMEVIRMDIDIMKKVISEHSEKLKKIS